MSPIISFKNFNRDFNTNLSPTPTERSVDVDQLIESLRSIGYGTQNSRGNRGSQLPPNKVSKPTRVRTANLKPMPSERVKKGQLVSNYDLRPRTRDKSRNGIDLTDSQQGHPRAGDKAAVTKKKRAGKAASKRKKP